MHFRKQSDIAVPATALDNWHHARGAFQRLSPPWEKVRVLGESVEVENGSQAKIQMKAGPVWTSWVAEHKDVIRGKEFTDEQIKGPFAKWRHHHQFIETGAESCQLVDDIHCELPFGPLGRIFGSSYVRNKLEKTFRYRHAITKMDLERAALEPDVAPKTILITGATGMVGTALETYLQMRGHHILRVTRSPQRDSDIHWDIRKGEMDLDKSKKIDAVVHLAGENIAGGRWTKKQKQAILESRQQGTGLICQNIAALENKPEVFISMSGANYYRQNTETPQTEDSPAGDTFLSKVCKEWEATSAPAAEAGIRVVHLRAGMVLSPAGGALSKMLPAFKAGIAGRLGTGQQRVAWIALDDLIDIIYRTVYDRRYTGPINVVAPHSPTNQKFTKELAAAVKRPAIIPAPAPALRLALGSEMADETLLADLSVAPGKLQEFDYQFRMPDTQTAFSFMLP